MACGPSLFDRGESAGLALVGHIMIDCVLVLGGGSAGFLASIFLKTLLPKLSVKVVRSADIGIIGVGEGSLDALTRFLHTTLGIDPNSFIKQAAPTWKLGLRFLNWGPRRYFDYTFARQFMVQWRYLPKLAGFYCDDLMEDCGAAAALMSENRVFQRTPQGAPKLESFAYHVENKQFVPQFNGKPFCAKQLFKNNKTLKNVQTPTTTAAPATTAAP